jgi:hypothetical protein
VQELTNVPANQILSDRVNGRSADCRACCFTPPLPRLRRADAVEPTRQISPRGRGLAGLALSTLLGDIATSVWSRSRRTVRSGLLAVARDGPRTTQLPGALAHGFRDSDLLRPGKRRARPLPGRLRLEQLLQFRSHRGTSRQTVSSVQPSRAEQQPRPIPLASRRSLPARPESADGPWPDRR